MIRTRLLLPVLTALSILAGTGRAAWAEPDCAALVAAIEATRQEGQVIALRALHGQALTRCPAPTMARLDRLVASAHLPEGQRRLESGDLEGARDWLEQALKYGQPWQVLALLGDVHLARRDRDHASAYFQRALNVIDDADLTPKAPPPDAIREIHGKAQNAGLAAETYSSPPLYRGTEPGGLTRIKFRGFVPVRVALPLTFEYDSTRFTAGGARAAADLAKALQRQKEAAGVILIGHTDERGSDDYNCALSLRRAAAVAAFLKEQGFAGTVTVVGMGKREPNTAPAAEGYGPADRDRLNRRVEFSPNGAFQATARACSP